MPIRCPRCGADNRDTARFCNVCGGQLPAPQPPLQPPAVQPRPKLPAPQPPVQPPASPTPSPPAPASRVSRSGIVRRGPVADGTVTVVDQERQEKPPFDPARAMVMLSLVILILAACAVGAVVSLALWIALLIVGVGGLGCLLPVLMGPLYFLAAPIVNWIRGERSILVLNFQVLDRKTGMPVDVVLFRKPGGGNVRLGDKVRVYGEIQRGTNVVRAREVQVHESGGYPANSRVEALQPWPVGVGLLVLGGTLAAILYIAMYFGLVG